MADKQIALRSAAMAAMATEPNRTVFIDTSLGTHLLMRLSCDDTVSHFKRKIEKEHSLSFSDTGEIAVHALKVRRREHLYCLSDSMLVMEAFDSAKKNWFLHADASTVEKKHGDQMHIENVNSENLLLCPEVALADRSVLPFDQEASQPNQTLTNKRKRDQIVERSDLQEEEVDTDKDASKPMTISQHSSVDKERVEIGSVDDNNLGTTNISEVHKKKKRKRSKDKEADEVPTSSVLPNTTSVLGEGGDGVSKPKPKEQESLVVVSKVDHHLVKAENNPSLVVKEPEELRMPIEVSIHKDTGSGRAEKEVLTKEINVVSDLPFQSGAIASTDNQKKKRRKKTKDPVTSGQENEPLREESNLPPSNTNELPRMNAETTILAKEDSGVIGTEVKNNQKTIENVEKIGNGEEETVKTKPKKKQRSLAKKLPNAQAEADDVNHQNPKLPSANSDSVPEEPNSSQPRSLEDNVNDAPLSANNPSNQVHNLEKQLPDIVAPNKALTEKKIAASKAAKKPKSSKNVKKPDVHSVQTSSKVQSSQNEKNQNLQESLTKERSGESTPHPEKKKPKPSKDVSKPQSSAIPDKLNSIPKQSVTINNTEKKKMESVTVSNSNMEKPKITVSKSATSDKRQSGTVGNPVISTSKVSLKDVGAIKNSLEPKKKLTAMSKSIFSDESEGSSEDEGADSSGSSTRPPSDYSSDYSDGASKFRSPQTGSQTSDISKSVDGKFLMKQRSEAGKGLFDSVLRSSSRYKQAKTTAHQSQLEEESQPVNIVPDSELV